MNPGEEKAWAVLASLNPADVCRRAPAVLGPAGGAYVVSVFGMPVTVDPGRRAIEGASPESECVVKKLAYFSHLSILHYLLGAQVVEPEGRLIKPVDLKASAFFLKGSHVLPLDALAARFARGAEGFMAQARRFGGERREHGDVAMEMRPLPRVPVTLVLWLEDDEFPARADLLFDTTGERHVPADILWTIAMTSLKVMMQNPAGK